MSMDMVQKTLGQILNIPIQKKNGCIAKFSIKQLHMFPHVAKVVEYSREDGLPSHELEDKLSLGRKSAYQPGCRRSCSE